VNTSRNESYLKNQVENIPDELKTYRSWVVWRYEERPGEDEPTKILYSPHTGRRAKTDDMRTWASFDDALDAFQEGGYSGIGFVFSSGDRYTGLDLDNSRDPETGVIEPWAEQTISALGGYAEVSPSGRGVHIIVRGELPQRARHKREQNGRKIEAYSLRRFFTITGRAL
jgi:putative DNA primase/helicase